MARTAILAVKIISDAKDATAGLDEAGGKFGKLGALASAAGVAIAGAGVAAGAMMVDAIGSAANLEQSVGAVDTVFKGSAGQMHEWAAKAADSVGLAQNEYNELATVLGTQLKNGGTSLDELGGKTNDLIGVGADLASMFGGTTADAVGALSSALKGERDPIERYGVSLTQASIDAKAAELGFSKVGGTLSAEANQAATLALIMEQTADAHGNFSRESDTLAHKQQVFGATMENLKTQLGTALLPVATQVMGALGKLAEAAGPALAQVFAQLGPVIGQVFTTLGPVIGQVLGSLVPAFTNLGTVVGQVFATLGPVVGQVIAALVPAFTSVAPIVGELAAVFGRIVATVATALVPVILNLVSAVLPVIVAGFQSVMPIVLDVARSLLDFVGVIMGILVPILNNLIPIVTTVFGVIFDVVGNVMATVGAIIRTVTAALRGDWSGAWQGMQDVLHGAVSTIKSVVSGLWDTIKSVFSAAWRTMSGIGEDLIGGLIQGVRDMAGRAVNAVRDVIGDAIGAAKNLLGIRSPSRVFATIGQQTGRGYVEGLLGQASAVRAATHDLLTIPTAATMAAPALELGAGPSSRRLGGDTYNIHLSGVVGDRDAVGRAVVDALNAAARRSGAVSVNDRVVMT